MCDVQCPYAIYKMNKCQSVKYPYKRCFIPFVCLSQIHICIYIYILYIYIHEDDVGAYILRMKLFI